MHRALITGEDAPKPNAATNAASKNIGRLVAILMRKNDAAKQSSAGIITRWKPNRSDRPPNSGRVMEHGTGVPSEVIANIPTRSARLHK